MPSTRPPAAALSLEQLTAIALAREDRGPVEMYLRLRGRISRRTFWLQGALGLFLAAMMGERLLEIAGLEEASATFWVEWALAWPTVAVSAKRWHDCGKSAGWAALCVVPVVLPLVLLVNGLWPGHRGPNRFGPDPLQPGPAGLAV